MKVVYVVPGFGGAFYCGNCQREMAFFDAMERLGHDFIILPVYLPISEEFSRHHTTPLFYNAINTYLLEKISCLKNLPRFLQKWLNSPWLLKVASKMSGTSSAVGLESLTISMLEGKKGRQAVELEKLISYLKDVEKPDVVHLSNALLMGMADEIKTQMNIPVVCSLQDEDVWVDSMRPEYRKQTWKLLSDKSKYVDRFIAVSAYFAGVMAEKMQISGEKMKVAYLGIDPSKYRKFSPEVNLPVIGYLSRMNKENGLDKVVDAFIELKKLPQFSRVRLKVCGGYTGHDKNFIKKQVNKLKKASIWADVILIEGFDEAKLPLFFEGLTCLSVPVENGEAFGIYQLEAYASGIPTVQPDVGAFREIAEKSGAGEVYSPNTPQALCEAWKNLLSDPVMIAKMASNGVDAVQSVFNVKNWQQACLEVYEELLSSNHR